MSRYPHLDGTCNLYLVLDEKNALHFTGITRTQSKRFIDSFAFDRGPSFRIVSVRARYGNPEPIGEDEDETAVDPTIDEMREAARAIRRERRQQNV